MKIEVRADGRPVEAASVVVNQIAQETPSDGVASFTLAAGAYVVVVSKEGLMPVTASITLSAGEIRTLVLELEPQASLEEHVVVSATRTGGRLEDQPMRVEVLDREEVEEKLMMTPGDIVMMLNEMGGLRVQATSPSLGAASVRVQGMRGRYTRFLSDGLPLFGEQAGSFGLLQIPPMDLGRVEVIKGVASSLYGAGAMGGVVNLISRRPGPAPEREVLINRSSRGATDGVFWLSTPLTGNWGATFLGSAHGQSRADVDHDGWSDLPYYARGVVRPRVFWDDKAGRSFFATAGFTVEDRTGATTAAGVIPGSPFAYVESLDTQRADVGVVAQALVAGVYVVAARASFVDESKAHQFGDVPERDRHRTAFGEVTARRGIGRQTVVVGAALEHDAFTPRDTPQFRYSFTVPGVFAQDDIAVSKWFSLSGSGRIDVHNEYGTFASPRLSALLRSNHWSSRASIGTGFYPATVLTEETEAAGLSRLVVETPLRPERGRSASVDLTYSTSTWSATATAFRSRVRDSIQVEREGSYVLRNVAEPTTNTGLELLATSKSGLLSVTATYAYVRARESGDGTVRDVALTPRHSAGLVGMWEKEDVGRIGVEWYYTGRQRLEVNPYRRTSRPYALFGALVERKFGAVRVFVNAENLGDVRQTKWDPLVRPTRGADGRWTVDAWAPLDGRNVNGGVRLFF